MVSFTITVGWKRWYVGGAYVPPNYQPTVHQVEQASVWPGGGKDAAGQQPQCPLGETSGLTQGGFGDSHHKLRSSGSETTLHPKADVQGEGRMVMEDVDRREAHCKQGGLHLRNGPQRLLQRLHYRTTSIYRLTDDPCGAQGVRRV